MHFNRDKGWKVKNKRPEEYLDKPEMYYTPDEIEKYNKSSALKKAQQSIAFRILELLELDKGKKILDLGCGTGYTLEIYKLDGYDVYGIDILDAMVKKAVEKGFKVKRGDMKELDKNFNEEEFDGVVSASALQWIKDDELINVVNGIKKILKKKGKLVIQFYPRSSDELRKVFKIFLKNGFSGKEVVDFADVPKKRVVFLVLEKF